MWGREHKPVESHDSPGRVRALQASIFQLISHHQDVSALFNEAVLFEREKAEHKQLSVQGLIGLIENEAAVAQIPIPQLAASVCARRIKHILSHNDSEQLLLTDRQKSELKIISEVILEMQKHQGFSRNGFIKSINKQRRLPIELVWHLHKEAIMPYEAYITSNLERPEVIGNFAQSISMLCHQVDPSTLDLRKNIIEDTFIYLIKQSFSERQVEDSTSKGLRKLCTALLDTIGKKLLNWDVTETGDLNPYLLLTGHADDDLDHGMLKRFSMRHITLVLSHNPNLKVSQALHEQDKWNYAGAGEFMRESFMHLMVAFDAADIIKLVRQVLEQQEVNWRSVLTFLATFLVTCEEAPCLVKGLITRWVTDGLERNELESLISAFLLARQASFEGPHVFPGYSDWFTNTFGDSSTSLASTKKSFMFLMKFLTDIVPFENAQMLKVHVLRTPYVPPSCRPILSDYILLAKTRLADLKESVEELGIYDESQTADKGKVEEQIQQDVERSLAVFEKTNKLPTSLMEASIFRKPYFVGRFLPSLLTPRPLPDIPDTKMRLIEALVRADKIPSSLYLTYQESCKKEAAQLLEGVFEEEDSMEELLLSPLEQIKVTLSNLSDKVMQGQTRGVAGVISILSEKLSQIPTLEADVTVAVKPVEVNMVTPQLESVALQVADLLLNSICHLATASINRPSPWLGQLATMVTKHSALLPAFIYRIWYLLTIKGSCLEVCHIQGQAAIMVYLISSSSSVSHVSLITSSGKIPFTEALDSYLSCRTDAQMRVTLRFMCCYLQYAFNMYKEQSTLREDTSDCAYLPPTLLKQFAYLVPRLYSSVRERCPSTPPGSCRMSADDPLQQVAETIYSSAVYKQHMQLSVLTFNDWLTLELQVVPHRDVLTTEFDRRAYYEWVVHGHFLGRSVSDGGCDGSYQIAATLLMKVLLQHEISSCSGVAMCQHGRESDVWQQTAGSQAQLTNLLQNLIEYLSHEPAEESSTKLPWLQSCLNEFTSAVTEQCQLESLLIKFFSIARWLPGVLLFSNSAMHQVDKEGLYGAIDITNNYLRNFMTDGSGALTLSMTSYLMQALLALQTQSNSLETFFQNCPLIKSSLVMHWSHLSSWFKRVTRQSSYLGAFTSSLSSMYDSVSGPFTDAWMKGVHLSAQIKKCDMEIKSLDASSLAAQYNTGDQTTEIMETCITYLLSHLTQSHTADKDFSYLQDATLELVFTYKQELMVTRGEVIQEELKMGLPDFCQHMLPVTVAKVLMHGGMERLITGIRWHHPWLLHHLLLLHISCNSLYTQDQDSKTTASATPQSLNIQFLITLSDFIKELLAQTPRNMLSCIPKNTVEKCDIDVRMMISKR